MKKTTTYITASINRSRSAIQRLILACCLLASLALPQATEAQNLTEIQKILASDAQSEDNFGTSVSISGDLAIVGASEEDSGGDFAGAAYIYARNEGGTNNWGEVKKILASDAQSGDRFGYSVSISGDLAIVGARGEDSGGDFAGAAYIYARNEGGTNNWGEVKKILASDAEDNDEFGYSVSISGDLAIVGAWEEASAGSGSGAVYIYARNEGGANNWGEVKKIVAGDPQFGDNFGTSVSISGDLAIVGAPFEDSGGSSAGAAYIYARNEGGTNNWGEVKKILASDAQFGDNFGWSVSISGDLVIVGARYRDEDSGGDFAGAAYIYARNEDGANNWGEVKKILASDAEGSDQFGTSVSISGDLAIVGAPIEDSGGSSAGAAYIYAQNEDGANNWGEVKKILASDAEGSDQFGTSVSISGDLAIVGARWEDSGGSSAGAAYIFGPCAPSVACKTLNDIDIEGCASDIPAALTNPSDVFDFEACGATVSMTSSDSGDKNLCGDGLGDGIDFERTYTLFFDGVAQTPTCSQNIQINDTTPPSINCPGDATVECGMSTAPDATGTATGMDVCGGVDITIISDNFVPGCGNTETITRTWKATDECGLMTTCNQIITIEDTTPPDLIFVPQAVTIACDGSNAPVNTGTAIATDICTPDNEIAITFNDVNSGTLCDGQTITRTWTATDLCGQSSSAEQIITVLSPVAPMITCPDLMVVECFADINPSADNATVTTQCTDPMVSVSAPVLTSGTADCNGSIYTVTYTVTDGCGQTASCTQDFAIVNDGPTIACAADETVECVEDINPTEADVAVMTACDVDSDIDISEATVFGQDGCSGTVYQFTYTVTDVCGREASCTRSYTLENDGPTIDAPADETVACFSDIAVDAEDALVEYACALDGDVEVSDPVQDGDDDCPGTTYTYTYTVTDECGRSASDEQVFTIQNAGPTIASPADQTVECASDIATDANAAVVTTSCILGSSVVISGPVRVGPENCPGTTYTYTYIVTDDCGRTASDDQVFTIGENDEPTIAVVPNITVDCFESINPNPNLADVTTACGNGVDFSVAVTDPVLGSGLNCPGEMYSVTYTVTDACGRTADATQTFTIANDGPTMECPDNCEVLSCYDGDYNAVIEAWLLTVSASTSCSMELTVSNDYNGVDGICVGDYTPVNFIATDACGRTATCESLIYIIDTDAPDIIGEPSELLVPCTGVTEDIFSDWLATRGGVEAYDACYEDDITWSTNPANPMALLDCSNGPQAIVVEFIVTDGCGNSASVNGIFNTKLLPNAVNVAGLIQTEAAEAVSSVEVSAYQSTGMAAMDLSDDNGDYNFEELPYEENTEIVPSRDGDYLNGVSTYDLILLQQHILDVQTLDSPYKRIAADANRSGTISTLDLVLLRRLILHIDEELADNTSWRFVDADFVFPNPANPFETDFPEAYNLSGEEEELKDFVAVKIGDLNLDAWTSGFSGQSDDRSGLEELIFDIEDQKLKAGETYEIEMNAQNFAAIRGFQLTLDYDQSLVDVLDLQSGALPEFGEANYNLAFAEAGKVPTSWHIQAGLDLDIQDVALRILIKAKADIQLSEVLSISSSLTKAEAYNTTELMNVSLNFSNNGASVVGDIPIAIGIELYQNQPNPFKDATTIGFQLPEAGEVTLEIYDVTGKLIYIERDNYAKGYHQIDLDRTNLQAGILYYQVSTATDSESKKMIVLE